MEEKVIDGVTTYLFDELLINGLAAELIPNGETGYVKVKDSLTSLDDSFYPAAENLCKLINCTIDNLNNLLIIINKENKARVYKNYFPISSSVILKREINKGDPVFKNDLLNISKISFSDETNNVDINPENGDQIIWICRTGFVFGLYFDLTKKSELEIVKKEMGQLYQQVLYYDVYKSLNPNIISHYQEYGWFPFIQLIGHDYESLYSIFKEKKTYHIEKWCEEKFSNERIKTITSRWWNNEMFKEKQTPIEEGLECFFENKFAACISTLTPMVEGLVNSYTVKNYNRGIKYTGDKIVKSLEENTVQKIDLRSLLFPRLFLDYLNEFFFQHTRTPESELAVRNTVSHGRAINESFNRESATKLILTLDQLLFFM